VSKVIFLTYVVFFPIMCLAQSPLPPCPWFGLAHNCFGTITLHFGAKYVGEFRDGKAHGQGTWTHPNGEKFVGEFRDGKAHGQGTVTFIDGRKHVGEWRDDKRNGQGIEYRANGSVIGSGRWENGNLVEPYALDTNRFPFDPSSPVAAAATSLPPLSVQSSLPPCPASGWKHNCSGTYIWFDGAKYIGEYRNDARNGQGSYTYPEGRKYVGEFRDNQLHGQGIEYRANGSVSLSGRWENNE